VHPAAIPLAGQPQLDPAKARRVSPNALILLAGFLAAGAGLAFLPSPPRVLTFAFVVLGWLLSLIVHEFGHAYVAYRGGDTSVLGRGYLTFDPLRYINNFTTLLLPLMALALGGIGLPGGAVQLNPRLIRSRTWLSMTSLAGPAGTLLVLLALVAVLAVLGAAGLRDGPLAAAVALLAFFQVTALILNLLPVPGLDGFGALQPFLPLSVLRAVAPVAPMAILALFGALMFVPGVSRLLIDGAFTVVNLAGVTTKQFQEGFNAFRFWVTPGA
jgi:Zn-dependent protease